MRIFSKLVVGVALFLGCFNDVSWAQAIPDTVGWHSLPNTHIRTVCPPNNFGGSGYDYPGSCQYVTAAWNSAVFDSLRNRMVIWGGGHSDYLGNELYALDLTADPVAVTRLNNPSVQIPTGCGIGITGDGQANSRHTYDHIVYMSHVDRMFVFGGASAPCGFFTDDTWTFSFATMQWEQRTPPGPTPEGNYGRVTAYSPVTKKVYIHDQTTLYAYSYENNAYTVLAEDYNNVIGQEMTGVFVASRQLFVLVGNGEVLAYDVSSGSTYQRQTWATSGAPTIVNAANPGVAYDSYRDSIVAWHGGNTAYELDLDTHVWAAHTYSGGPGAAISNGTFKRWAYSPESGAYVVCNSVDANCFALRLQQGAGTPPDQVAPGAPSALVVQ